MTRPAVCPSAHSKPSFDSSHCLFSCLARCQFDAIELSTPSSFDNLSSDRAVSQEIIPISTVIFFHMYPSLGINTSMVILVLRPASNTIRTAVDVPRPPRAGSKAPITVGSNFLHTAVHLTFLTN